MPTQESAPSLTIINLKGGVGKTHTVWLLTGVCIERGKKLLAVDTDTQANLTRSLLPGPLEGPGIEALFDPAAEASVQDLIRPTRFSGVDILPASPAVAPFDLSDLEEEEPETGAGSLEELVQWHERRRQEIHSLPIDDKLKRFYESQLSTRFAELSAQLFENIEPRTSMRQQRPEKPSITDFTHPKIQGEHDELKDTP